MIGAGEIVHLRQDERAVPTEFFWRGERHIVRSSEARRQGPAGKGRRVFRVRTATGLRCEISEDAGRGLWRMERVLRARRARG